MTNQHAANENGMIPSYTKKFFNTNQDLSQDDPALSTKLASGKARVSMQKTMDEALYRYGESLKHFEEQKET
jgi:hypothetical protein